MAIINGYNCIKQTITFYYNVHTDPQICSAPAHFSKFVQGFQQLFETLQFCHFVEQILRTVKDRQWTICPKSVNLFQLEEMVEHTEFL